MEEKTVSMRFFGVPDRKVVECLNRMKSVAPFRRYLKRDADASLAPYYSSNTIEVIIEFDSDRDFNYFKTSGRVKEIYRRLSKPRKIPGRVKESFLNT